MEPSRQPPRRRSKAYNVAPSVMSRKLAAYLVCSLWKTHVFLLKSLSPMRNIRTAFDGIGRIVPARVARNQNGLTPIAPTHAAVVMPMGALGKPVGAVMAAASVLRALHAATRPLNASEVARAAGLHRGTAYNILRTLQAEGFVSYDEATRTYAVSLHILELA